MITVMDVFRARGEPAPEPTVSWAVGTRVASIFKKAYGRQPQKELRPKTGSGGTHCFAVYPDGYRKIIEQVIDAVGASARRQSDLF